MTLFLVDKSAFEQRQHNDQVRTVLDTLVAQHRLATCEIVALELLYSARGATDYEVRWNDLQSWVWLAVNADVTQQALDIQRRLARRGQHRRPIPDLLVAATALVHGATVLHYDKDFDLIAEVTGQPVRWIIPRGTGHAAGR